MGASLYDILGVPENAGEEEIRAAYRRQTATCHPDLILDDMEAPLRFRRLEGVIAILGDAERRRLYDMGQIGDESGDEGPVRPLDHFYRTHAEGPEGAKYARGPGNDAPACGNGARGADVPYSLMVTFLDAAKGLTREATLPNGHRADIIVPAGIENGQVIRLKGQGEPGANGAPAGDVLLYMSVKPHPVFGRQGNDIVMDMPLTVAEATQGTQIRIPSIHGPLSARVPPGTDSGTTLRFKGKGIHPHAGEPGDHIVRTRIVLTHGDPRAMWEGLL